MSYSFKGIYPNQEIYLTFDKQEFIEPNCVLVFPFYKSQLLLTKHRTRGWELPGGTREAKEWPIGTAVRETYEETGAELSAIELIGQYRITTVGEPPQIKSIYLAYVWQLHNLPSGFETTAIKLLAQLPGTEEVKSNPEFSPLLKDDVYRLTREVVKTRLNLNIVEGK